MIRHPLTRWAAAACVGALAMAACTSAASTEPATLTHPATEGTIEFAIGAEPLMSTDPIAAPDGNYPDVSIVGNRLIVDDRTGTTKGYGLDDNRLLWSLNGVRDPVGDDPTRPVLQHTSPAAGGIVLFSYTERCRQANAPCTGLPDGTVAVYRVIAISVSDGEAAWTADLGFAGPAGSATEGDESSIEPHVMDADGDSILVTLSTYTGEATSAGTPGMTTVLLDAETGAEQWRVGDFRGGFLTTGTVFGVRGEISEDDVPAAVINSAVDRNTGAAIGLGSSTDLWVLAGGSPGVLVDDGAMERDPGTSPLYLVGPDGQRAAGVTDDQYLTDAECPARRVESGLLACAMTTRSNDSVLVTWANGEPAPSMAQSPLPGRQQLWAVSGDILLISENGYQLSAADEPSSWFAVDRDGTVISERRPGTAVAGSADYVVTRSLDAEGRCSFSVWPIVQRP